MLRQVLKETFGDLVKSIVEVAFGTMLGYVASLLATGALSALLLAGALEATDPALRLAFLLGAAPPLLFFTTLVCWALFLLVTPLFFDPVAFIARWRARRRERDGP